MCGRYTLAHSTKEILERFQVEQLMIPLEPRYNIAPSQIVPVVVNGDPDAALKAESGGAGDTGKGERVRCLIACKWGLVPFWVKDLKKIKPMINARVETIMEKPTYKNAFAKRRCLIPADGFYEWKDSGGQKTPMRIRLKGDRLFAFAGLYEDWKAPDGSILRTCTIITVPVNKRLADIHDRMPAILTPQDESSWLDHKIENKGKLFEMLVPYADSEVEAYAVSKAVNSPKVDSEECARPVTAESKA